MPDQPPSASAPPIARHAEARVRDAMADTRIVALVGPRQSGKTTLARRIAADRSLAFVTLDAEKFHQFANDDPSGFIRGLDRVVIDEIQRAPGLRRHGQCLRVRDPPARWRAHPTHRRPTLRHARQPALVLTRRRVLPHRSDRRDGDGGSTPGGPLAGGGRDARRARVRESRRVVAGCRPAGRLSDLRTTAAITRRRVCLRGSAPSAAGDRARPR